MVAIVGHEGVEIAVTVEVSQLHGGTVGIPQRLCLGEGAGRGRAVIFPHAVGLSVGVCHEGVEVAVAVNVSQCDLLTVGGSQRLTTVDEGAGAVVEIDEVGLVAAICHEGVQVTIAIDVSQRHGAAVVSSAQCLAGGEDSSVVDVHAVG